MKLRVSADRTRSRFKKLPGGLRLLYFVTEPDPDRVAYSGAVTLTFRDVSRNASRVANLLRSAGLEPGHVVAVATADAATFFVCFTACYCNGFPIAVIDPHASSRELALALRKANPRAVFADESILDIKTGDIVESLPPYTWQVGGFGSDDRLARFSRHGDNSIAADLDAVKEPESLGQELRAYPKELPAYFMFTSGTTSDPKAVSISRHALQTHIDTLARVFAYDATSRLLNYMATHNADGLVHGAAVSLFTGMTIVHPGPFDTNVDLRHTLRANKITHFLAVPTMLSIIRHGHSDCRDLFSYNEFRSLVSTAGLLHEEFWTEFQDFFNVRVANFYGMTETVSGSLFCGPDDDTFRVGSLGKPVDAVVRIVDANGSEVTDGEVGELQISGDHLMSGYLNDSEATLAVLQDGWLSSGDLFTCDEDGFFRIVGRKKSMINRGGVSVYPEDLQRILVRMPGIVEVEVVGLPDSIFEEIIVICAVIRDGTTEDDIRAFCRREFAEDHQPDKVMVMEQLPRGPSGKVQRSALVSRLRAVEAPADGLSVRERIVSLAARVFAVPGSELNDESSPDTVENWDSYAAMEFILSLEREFELKLQAEDFMRIINIGLAIEVISNALDKRSAEPGSAS